MDSKKNMQEIVKNNPQSRIFYFDESRFGTHSKLGHGWFKKGKRSRVKVHLKFDNFYLYSAIEPNTGENFTMEVNAVNTAGLNIFLEQFANQYINEKIIFIMDGASWHRSNKIKIPKNITILFLPPYSPELNPVERYWLYIKRHTIKNQFYENLSQIRNALWHFIINSNNLVIANLCKVNCEI